MIGLILGTSEGKEILSGINKFTSDVFVSTATEYGGSLLKDYKYSCLNDKPLDFDGLVNALKQKKVQLLVDASHPYAVLVTENAMKACEYLNIEYIRYDRPSCIDSFRENNRIVTVENYKQLYKTLVNIHGNIFNTTGSKNLQIIMNMPLKNRIIHRVLPKVEILEKCKNLGVKIEDIVAMKGPVSYEMNCLFIREYHIKAMILKDSGIPGGTYEKVKACLNMNICPVVIDRKKINYRNVFTDIGKMIDYIREKYSVR